MNDSISNYMRRGVTSTDEILFPSTKHSGEGEKMQRVYGNAKELALSMMDERERSGDYSGEREHEGRNLNAYNDFRPQIIPKTSIQKPIKFSTPPQPQPYTPYSQYSVPINPNPLKGGDILSSCVDCLTHIQGCPVCSRLYDKSSLYMIAIVIMAVAILYLLKRLLERRD